MVRGFSILRLERIRDVTPRLNVVKNLNPQLRLDVDGPQATQWQAESAQNRTEERIVREIPRHLVPMMILLDWNEIPEASGFLGVRAEPLKTFDSLRRFQPGGSLNRNDMRQSELLSTCAGQELRCTVDLGPARRRVRQRYEEHRYHWKNYLSVRWR